MSFGFSPSDVINLVQYSTRVYVAFKDANDNSETQVASLVRSFSAFHHYLLQFNEHMKEYGKPLPLPYHDFRETLKRCEETIEPYKDNLVDRKMSMKKFIYTIKYIGKEKEIENLRRQIDWHCQVLQLHMSSLILRSQSEGKRQTESLTDSTSFRTVSIGGQTTNAIGSSSRTAPLALPAPSEADQWYKDSQNLSRRLKRGDERFAIEEGGLSRPLSLGATSTVVPARDDQTVTAMYHLTLEDLLLIEENRAKRIAAEQRTHLLPSEAVRQEVRNLPPIPQRTYTLDTDHSGLFSGFETDHGPSMSESTATIRPTLGSPTPAPPSAPLTTSPTGSPQIPASYFEPVNWTGVSPSVLPSSPPPTGRTPSVSTVPSDLSASPGSHLPPNGLGVSTIATTPEDEAHILCPRLSTASLVTIALGPGALQWNKLCHKVHVERASPQGVESRICDVQWRKREDGGITLRSLYRSSITKEVKVWVTQQFPATGPSTPLTTSYPDGDVSIEFPNASFGKLDKGCTDIKYTLTGTEASTKFQTLLYTNDGKDAAELLFDRPIATICSNLHKPECRGKNLRLWKRREVQMGLNGIEVVDVLELLFYTSALPEGKAHWVKEPHYSFQWLDSSVCKKSAEKLKLIVSKEPGKWSREKVFPRRKSSKSSSNDENYDVEPGKRRRSTMVSGASSVESGISARSMIGGGRCAQGNLHKLGCSEVDIKFQKASDRRDFIEVWSTYVKPL
ncbi:hypothetical protein CC80DRAFT_512992 [Byssothecium circinans]|uniref:Uncharacterized protein n=1 Tax=Byssothecium circinans TaxID=147558 RepID=A0A6A5UGA5_9PLEO|nr:hypothetical protein CC80DRAFT_512992 [Byssothecium circinans]